MIKNKCFAKKRRMGYCLLAGLLDLNEKLNSGFGPNARVNSI